MCGIVGFWHRDPARPAEEAAVRAMCDAIVHRGPDDAGWLLDRHVALGMRRLSIIDLGGGHQPIRNEDGQVAVVFNGEIYNFPELRRELESLGHAFKTRSDTETLVHGYESWGDDLPRHLNGMFAFSVWDARRQRVLLARDHLGIKPLYLYEDERLIAWASEIKALLRLPEIRAELDPAALVDFLHFGYVPAPRTMFRGIRKVAPAHRVTIDWQTSKAGRVVESPFWDLAFDAEQRSVEDWCHQLRSLLDDAVQRQLMSDVPLGAFLSGGLDSSSIVATMRRLGVAKVSTYAIGFGGADAFHSELGKARRLAQHFDTDHHEIVVEPNVAELMPPLIGFLDEPITDTSFLVTYLISQLARQSVKVILSGVGGDEIFGGYRRYLGPRLQARYALVPGPVHRQMLLPLVRRMPVDRGSALKSMARYVRGFLEQVDLPEPERYQAYVGIFRQAQVQSLFAPAWRPTVAGLQSSSVADCYRAAPSDDPLNRMMYADVKTALVDSLLAFTDKMTMAVSLEARVPLLDYRLVELAARIPGDLRLKGLRGLKHIFKLALRDRLPEYVFHQKKQGFGTPISRWFRGSLRPMLDDLLSRERLEQRGYFDSHAVWSMIDDHLHERADHSEHILALLTFEIWHQQFLDRAAA